MDDLQSQVEQLLTGYDGKPTYQNEVLLCSPNLFKAQETYLNGAHERMSTEDNAKRILGQIKNRYPDSFQRGEVLKVALQNARPALRQEMIALIGSGTIQLHEISLNVANITEQVQSFKDNDIESWAGAKAAMRDARDARKDETELAKILAANKENRFFRSMISEASTGDAYISRAAADAGYPGTDDTSAISA